MLRVLATFSISLFFACSSDSPSTPTGPAAKASTSRLPFPTNLRVEAITSTSARLLWDSVDSATDYDISYKKVVGGKWKILPHRGTATSARLSGLQPSTKYRWTVKADSGEVKSRWAVGVNFMTLASSSGGSSTPTDPLNSLNPIENKPTSADTTRTILDDNFNIELVFVDRFSLKEHQVISEAAYEWEQYILAGFPEHKGIDDLRIRVRKNTHSSSSPCLDASACVTLEGIRPNTYIPYDALLYIDLEPPWGYRDNEWIKKAEWDYQRYIATHEIGHALGLVGLHSVAFPLGLVHDSEDNDPYGEGGQPYFSGPEAQKVFNEALAQSSANYRGEGVPLDVRTSFRLEGTPDYRGPQHWPARWLGTSVLSDGYFEWIGKGVTQKGRLVTQLDLAALADLGYQVNLEDARPIEIGYYSGFRYSPSADRKTGTYSWGKLISPNQTSSRKAVSGITSWSGNH